MADKDTGLGTKVKKVQRQRSKRAMYLDYVTDTQTSGGKALSINEWMASQKKKPKPKK